MAKVYLIGGVPRCGKTSIALQAVGKKPMFSTSTDSVRFLLRDVYTYEQMPALFDARDKFSESAVLELYSTGRAHEIIDAQNKESEIVWKAVRRVIDGYLEEDIDILIEGVAILPSFIATVECDYKAIFVGNTSPRHAEYMLAHARSGRYDWLSKRSDESIKAFAKFTNEFSEFFAQEAAKYNMEYVEYGDGDFNEYVAEAAEKLIN